MPHADSALRSERVLIHAPYGRDAALIDGELIAAGFATFVCKSVEELCACLHEGAGAALVGDEALSPKAVETLAGPLSNQPPWSNFPLLVMTSGGGATRISRYRLQLQEPLGNVTLIERPVRPVTLVEQRAGGTSSPPPSIPASRTAGRTGGEQPGIEVRQRGTDKSQRRTGGVRLCGQPRLAGTSPHGQYLHPFASQSR